MKVKATSDFSYYRLQVLEGLSVDNFRALQQGEIVDIDKKLYDKNKHIFEVIKTSKEVKDGS